MVVMEQRRTKQCDFEKEVTGVTSVRHGLVFLSSTKYVLFSQVFRSDGTVSGWTSGLKSVGFYHLYTHFLMRPAACKGSLFSLDFIEKTIQRMSSKCCIRISLG